MTMLDHIPWKRIGLMGVLLLATTCQLTALSTPGWSYYTLEQFVNGTQIKKYTVSSGLWQICYEGECIFSSSRLHSQISRVWLNPVRGLQLVGLVNSFAAMVFGIFACATWPAAKTIKHSLLTTCLLAAVCIVIGVVIYAAKFTNTKYYSFGLAIVATVLNISGGVITIFNFKDIPKTKTDMPTDGEGGLDSMSC